MTPVTAAKMKYGVWGLICGAVIAMIVGFIWGGWTTSGTTKRLGDEAVLAARAAICVAQFMKQPNAQEQLQAFEKIHIPPNYVVERVTLQRKPPEVRIWRLSIQSAVGTRPPSTSTPHWPACLARR
jgi:hypothetical protein